MTKAIVQAITVTLSIITLHSFLFMFVSAWPTPTRISSHRRARRYPHPLRRGTHDPNHIVGIFSLNSVNQPELSSAYDRSLPAALVGEAVRSALRSDRGVCFDFTKDRYSENASGTSSRLTSIVKIDGKGTSSFINSKFSQSIPNVGIDGCGGVLRLSSTTELLRKGHAFETAYLTSKGRIIDKLLVLSFPSSDENSAFLITSPGNSGSTLYNELSPLVFPMDKVTLTDCSSGTSCVITLACSSLKDANTSFKNNVLKLLLGDDSFNNDFEFPTEGICHHYRVHGRIDVYMMQHSFLSSDICYGYTLLFQESDSSFAPALADAIWENLTSDNNDRGPVGVGSLEFDTLRVEAGLPGYGNEMTGDGPKKDDTSADDTYYAKSNPLELHLQSLINTEKGCYQGQEGIASMLKNPRGCPRQLYQVIFHDSENDFNGDAAGFGLLSTNNDELMNFQRLKKQAPQLSNGTRQPRPGDDIYVLGSNDFIQVGKITSVAQPNGTGDGKTIALALTKRPSPILNSMKEQGLDLPKWWEDYDDDVDGDSRKDNRIASEKDGSGLLQPPPLDPLHNLEIVVGGTYTFGRLASLPSRRYYSTNPRGGGEVATLLDYESKGDVVEGEGAAYFGTEFQDVDVQYANTVDASSRSTPTIADEAVESTDEGPMHDLLAKAEEDFAKAAADAEAAAAEAKRKEDKMKLLKAKAEAAMAQRRKKKD